MKPKQYLILASIFFLLSGWSLAIESRTFEEQLASSISPHVLRFHILAASDSSADQSLKLQVRDIFLEMLRKALPKNADKQDIMSYANREKDFLESSLNAYIKKQGFSDQVSIQTASVRFPRRTYGDFTFPCGVYDSLQVYIGPANGHNWWCVLYPSLCFTEESGPSLPDSSCRILQESLEEGTYLDMRSQKTSIMDYTKNTDTDTNTSKTSCPPSEKTAASSVSDTAEIKNIASPTDKTETRLWIQKPLHALVKLLH